MRYHTWLKSEERKDMYIDENEDDIFDFAGDTTVETDDEVNENEVEEEAEEAEESREPSINEDEVADEPDEEKEEKSDEEEPKKKDSKTQALDAERARRKQAEKELKELKAKIKAEKDTKEAEDIFSKEREAYKKKMLEGDLIDEDTADKLLDVFGNDVIKNKLDSERRSENERFEEEFQELKRDNMFMDADVYKPQMRELVTKNGLSARQAYMASISDAKFMQLKNDLKVEAEQKVLNNQERAEKINVGVQESKSEIQGTTYSKEEQRIAKETGLSLKEVHKRIKMDSIEEFEKL